MTPEGKIKAKFNKGLKILKEKYGHSIMVRMPVSRGMGKPLLDYLFCVRGKFILVEAKRDAEHELTPQQKTTRDECLDAGGTVLVIYDDSTIKDALSCLEMVLYKWPQ